MKYNVFYYMSFHTKVVDIEADSQKEAIAKGIDAAWASAHLHSGTVFEFAEECTGALVDEQGDEEYSKSKLYNQGEVYNAESRD